jgi:hypothetical protein
MVGLIEVKQAISTHLSVPDFLTRVSTLIFLALMLHLKTFDGEAFPKAEINNKINNAIFSIDILAFLKW